MYITVEEVAGHSIPFLPHLPDFQRCAAKNSISSAFATGFSIAAKCNKNKAENDSSKIVQSTGSGKSIDGHHVQASDVLNAS